MKPLVSVMPRSGFFILGKYSALREQNTFVHAGKKQKTFFHEGMSHF